MADEKNFQAPAFTAKGTSRDKVALPEALFHTRLAAVRSYTMVRLLLGGIPASRPCAHSSRANASTISRASSSRYCTGGDFMK